MIGRYHRPYCRNCNLIWGRQAIGSVLKCTQCGSPLVLKSFNPWFKILGGVAIIGASVAIIFMEWVPLIWIGGFILGPVLIFNAIKNQSRIRKLDDGRKATQKVSGKARRSEVKGSWKEYKEPKSKSSPVEQTKYITITCGKCFGKMSVPKGKGLIRVTCPHCSAKHAVRT
jgi:DNA-directed RNA polymerase subunit RPC12/RpoP